MTQRNPFTSQEIAAGYEAWYQSAGRRADRQEKDLLKWLVGHFTEAHSILEVGCGTGHFTRWFGEQGFQAIGLDISRPMMEQAKKLGSPTCLQGDAYKLPFSSNSFDLVVMITTLEFLPSPVQALAEAARVSRQGLILGVLNAQSRLGRQYKKEAGPVWESARFFAPLELRRLLKTFVGEQADVSWQTTLWPLWPGALPLPWGGFIGMISKSRLDNTG